MDAGRTKRALVIGAHGVLGSLTVRAFAAAGWAVRCGVRSAPRGAPAREVEIDLARPESIAATLSAHELVVNTVPHPDLLAERHVLERGGCLINISALPAAAARSLRAVAAGARGTVLMNAGLAPGLSTVVAAELLRLHPEATELEMAFTFSSTIPRGPASAEFVHRGLTSLARHRTARIPLPKPFGERICVGFGEGDAGWLGGVAEGRIVRQYMCINEPAVHQRLLELNRTGGMAELPISLIGSLEPPIDGRASNEPVAHWIAAIRRRRRLGARTIQCRGYFLHAARSALVFADALVGQRPGRGCLDPEEICTVSSIEGRLRDAGIAIVAHP